MSYAEVTEWWDRDGYHHDGSPSWDEMLDEAVQVTGHVWDDEGNDIYWTSFSDDGWTEEEWAEDVDDAYSHYVGGEQ